MEVPDVAPHGGEHRSDHRQILGVVDRHAVLTEIHRVDDVEDVLYRPMADDPGGEPFAVIGAPETVRHLAEIADVVNLEILTVGERSNAPVDHHGLGGGGGVERHAFDESGTDERAIPRHADELVRPGHFSHLEESREHVPFGAGDGGYPRGLEDGELVLLGARDQHLVDVSRGATPPVEMLQHGLAVHVGQDLPGEALGGKTRLNGEDGSHRSALFMHCATYRISASVAGGLTQSRRQSVLKDSSSTTGRGPFAYLRKAG